MEISTCFSDINEVILLLYSFFRFTVAIDGGTGTSLNRLVGRVTLLGDNFPENVCVVCNLSDQNCGTYKFPHSQNWANVRTMSGFVGEIGKGGVMAVVVVVASSNNFKP